MTDAVVQISVDGGLSWLLTQSSGRGSVVGGGGLVIHRVLLNEITVPVRAFLWAPVGFWWGLFYGLPFEVLYDGCKRIPNLGSV